MNTKLEEVLKQRSILEITEQEEIDVAVKELLNAVKYKTFEEYTEVEKQAIIDMIVYFFLNHVFKDEKTIDWASKSLEYIETVQKEFCWGQFKTLSVLFKGIPFWDLLSNADKRRMAKEIIDYLKLKTYETTRTEPL